MAVYICDNNQALNSSTLKLVDATSFLFAENVSTVLGTTAYVASQNFTPGAITVEGHCVRISGVASIGQFQTRLFNATDAVAVAEVTINVSDLPPNTIALGEWVYFKYSAPVTLIAGKAYNIQARNSTANQVSLYRNATISNWSRALVTSSTGTMASTDSLIIAGPWTAPGTFTPTTCLSNNTNAAITYTNIFVGSKGKLTQEMNPATNYHLRVFSGIIAGQDGEIELGTPSSRMPVDSSLTVFLSSAAVGGTRFDIRSPAKLVTGGYQYPTRRAYIVNSFNVGATSLTTNISTGWLNGNQIAVGNTTRAASPAAGCELRLLGANASGTTLTTSSTMGIAKNVLSPVFCPVINLQSNIRVSSGNTSQTGAMAIQGPRYDVTLDNVSFQFLGGGTTVNCGIFVNGVAGTSASFIMRECAFFNMPTNAILVQLGTSTPSATITGNVCVGTSRWLSLVNTGATGSTVVTDNWSLGAITDMAQISAVPNITYSNNLVNASNSIGHHFTYVRPYPTTLFSTFDGNIAICNSTFGHYFNGSSNIDYLNPVAYRNNSTGISFNAGNNDIRILNGDIIGNTTAGITSTTAGGFSNCTFTNLNIQSQTGNIQSSGILFIGSIFSHMNNFFDRCNIGTTSAHGSADISGAATVTPVDMGFRNCNFGSPTRFSASSGSFFGPGLFVAQANGAAGSHQNYKLAGSTTRDSVIFDNSPCSERLTPNAAGAKLLGSPFMYPVASGQTLTVSVRVRKSAVADGTAYTGAQPRLILERYPAAGSSFNSDIVCATASAANGTWETLTYTTPAVNDDCALRFYVDCDGTAGWVNWDNVTG